MAKKRPKTYSGPYKPKNKAKYIGNPSTIIYRSLWERRWMVLFDSDDRIIRWSSEEIIIPYMSALDKEMHRYFPDFYIEYKDVKGVLKKVIIEVKPKIETSPPIKPKRQTKTYLNEVFTFIKNDCKWQAARQFCKKNGYEFSILTEDHLKDMTGIFK